MNRMNAVHDTCTSSCTLIISWILYFNIHISSIKPSRRRIKRVTAHAVQVISANAIVNLHRRRGWQHRSRVDSPVTSILLTMTRSRMILVIITSLCTVAICSAGERVEWIYFRLSHLIWNSRHYHFSSSLHPRSSPAEWRTIVHARANWSMHEW